MYNPELAYRSDGPERGTRNEGLYMRSVGKRKTLGPFRRFVRLHSDAILIDNMMSDRVNAHKAHVPKSKDNDRYQRTK